MATHYETLGIADDATHDEIVQAYFRRTSGSRTAGFLRGSRQSRSDREGIETAYSVLIDHVARREYDRSLKVGE